MTRLAQRLPQPIDFGWGFRPVESADIQQIQLGDGRREVLINHAPLAGVTTEMLAWWFTTFDGIATYRGQKVPAYRLWHPRDHIQVEFERAPAGSLLPLRRIHIQEVMGRDPGCEVEVHGLIHRWDRRGVGFHRNILGHKMFELDHVFEDTPAGVDYRTRLRMGASEGPLRGLLNAAFFGRAFSPEAAAAWIRHNVEEVGCFAHFLPEVFAEQAIAPA